VRGFHFRGSGTATKRPLLIFNNGSDGSMLASLTMGGYGALARGYDVLTFDGPGQGYALWKQSLYFRPDWEKVITPGRRLRTDPRRRRCEADRPPRRQPGRLLGTGRAVAFEKRIAAAVADPGVVDVSTSWFGQLSPDALALLKSGPKAEFDARVAEGLPPKVKATAAFCMRPYGMTSYFDVFTAVQQYNPRRRRPDHLPDAGHRPGQRGLLARPVAGALRPAQNT
jgi:hypothetical protein